MDRFLGRMSFLALRGDSRPVQTSDFDSGGQSISLGAWVASRADRSGAASLSGATSYANYHPSKAGVKFAYDTIGRERPVLARPVFVAAVAISFPLIVIGGAMIVAFGPRPGPDPFVSDTSRARLIPSRVLQGNTVADSPALVNARPPVP